MRILPEFMDIAVCTSDMDGIVIAVHNCYVLVLVLHMCDTVN